MVHHNQRRTVHVVHFPPQFTDWRVGLQQGLSGNAPDCQYYLRFNQVPLPTQIAAATFRFIRLGITVTRRPALEDVGDKYRVPLQTNRPQHFGQQLPRLADKRFALFILMLPWRFTDDHPLGLLIARAEHGVGAGVAQTTFGTSGDFGF